MFYIIVSGDTHSYCRDAKKQFVSFSLGKKDVCFGHTKPVLIPNYTLHDYVMEFGTAKVNSFKRDADYEMIPFETTVLEYLKVFIPALSKYRFGVIKGNFVYYADFDKCRASEYIADKEHLKNWAKNNGIVLKY